MTKPEVIIAGGGIGGLTLALELDRLGIRSRVYEAVREPAPVGVGITVLPHATRVLSDLGLADALMARGLVTRESLYYNRFGQFVFREEVGTESGLRWPQLSVHRGDLYQVLLDAAMERLGPDRVRFGHRMLRAWDDGSRAFAEFSLAAEDGPSVSVDSADAVIGADGIHSTLRRQLYPTEGEPLYQGINMWRGVTFWPPFLSGASMLRVGWYSSGKLTIYPCRPAGPDGRQLMNWIAALHTPRHIERDWGRQGRLEDFLPTFADWKFDFLDVPGVLETAESVLEYPMVDQEPLPRWTFGRLTLLGDAAHPMVPRGSNGAGQAIVDCRVLAESLAGADSVEAGLMAYEAVRRPATAGVVYRNRTNPPDAILREVYDRTGDQPFTELESVISQEELKALAEGYRDATGYSRRALAGK
ncbi:MAG TPA: flavin-dependent oxidoreductase [Acidimicrobiales bacterium]|nr:flavin-dependent oxidoreductase [Acidimicrobiales bacterium]